MFKVEVSSTIVISSPLVENQYPVGVVVLFVSIATRVWPITAHSWTCYQVNQTPTDQLQIRVELRHQKVKRLWCYDRSRDGKTSCLLLKLTIDEVIWPTFRGRAKDNRKQERTMYNNTIMTNSPFPFRWVLATLGRNFAVRFVAVIHAVRLWHFPGFLFKFSQSFFCQHTQPAMINITTMLRAFSYLNCTVTCFKIRLWRRVWLDLKKKTKDKRRRRKNNKMGDWEWRLGGKCSAFDLFGVD